MSIIDVPFVLRVVGWCWWCVCGSRPSIDHETAYRLTLYLWSEGFYSRLALVCTIKIHISLTCLFFFWSLQCRQRGSLRSRQTSRWCGARGWSCPALSSTIRASFSGPKMGWLWASERISGVRHHTATSGLLLVTQTRANLESFRSQLAKLLFCVPSRDFSNPNTQVRISKQECFFVLEWFNWSLEAKTHWLCAFTTSI